MQVKCVQAGSEKFGGQGWRWINQALNFHMADERQCVFFVVVVLRQILLANGICD